MELYAAAVNDGTVLTADICIVGAGPTGLALAYALSRRGDGVMLVESGGSDPSRALQDLNVGDVAGEQPYQVLAESRSRGIGGSAALWNTALHGAMTAKYAELDPIDFEARTWMPHSGWPFPKTDLEPWYHAARDLVGSLHWGTAQPGSRRLTFADGSLVNRHYRFGTPEPFTQRIPARLYRATGVTVVRGATVTRIVTAAGDKGVRELHWKTLTGKSGTVRASTFVLAAGGIENARLLLAVDHPACRQSRWLGRGFMEHPVDRSLELTLEPAGPINGTDFYAPHGDDRGECIMGRVGLSDALMREVQLANASLRLIAETRPPSAGGSRLRAVARRLLPSGSLHRLAAGLIHRGRETTAPVLPTRYRVLLDLEQAPHPDNRIVLSGRSDRLGCPRVELHWRWRNTDEQARQKIVSTLKREFERSGIGKLHLTAASLDANTHHHAGATRMHTNPEEGVVDEQLRVHGLGNLYVTGSSVFPTAGFANPTLTALALSLRLADHLRQST